MKKPHIHLEPSASYARAIVCGSPERAKIFASKLTDSRLVAANREYHSYLGKHQGHEILIMSHGVGAAGAAIGFQELIDCGAKAIVRIGTAGGLTDDSQIGDIVVATAAVRKEGLSHRMVPAEFPAVSDLDLVNGLRGALQSKGWPKSPGGKLGVVLTTDLFYSGPLDDELRFYQKAGCVAVEMEISALLVVSHLRGVKAAGMVVLDGNPLKRNDSSSGDHYDPRPERLAASVDQCFESAVAALIQVPLN